MSHPIFLFISLVFYLAHTRDFFCFQSRTRLHVYKQCSFGFSNIINIEKRKKPHRVEPASPHIMNGRTGMN